MKKNEKLTLRWLLSSWSILIAAGIGIWLGIKYKSIAESLAPFGKLYLSILQMCILPILFTAVSCNLGKIIRSTETKISLKKTLFALLIMMFAISIIGTLFGHFAKPGILSEKNRAMMGTIIHKSKKSYPVDMEMNFFTDEPESQTESPVIKYITGVVPKNIFKAMAESRNLQVLFVAILLGVALGFVPEKQATHKLLLLESIFMAFSEIIKWAMYLLPFGLCCLLADQVSKIGLDMLKSMTNFIICFTISSLFMIVVGLIIIWKRSKRSLIENIQAMKDPVIVALGTRNSLATLPSAIESLDQNLGFDKQTTRLLLPLSITLGRFGNILYFALVAIFVAQLYSITLGFTQFAIIIIGSVLAGMATAGATGILTLSMIILVLEPLQLPVEAVLILLITIDPIIDPLRTLTIVSSSCAVTSLVAIPEINSATQDKTEHSQGA